MGFDPLGGEVPDRADSQVALERAEDGFDFSKLNVLAPEFGRIAGPPGWCADQPQARVLDTDFDLSPGLLVTLLESA